MLPGPPVKKRAVRDGLPVAQMRIECRGAARHAQAEGRGEVELIDVAGANPLMNGGYALGVFSFRQREFGFNGPFPAGRGRRCVVAEIGESGRLAFGKGSGTVVEGITPLVDSKPGEWLAGTGRLHGSGGLKALATFVTEEAGSVVARGNGGLNFSKERGDL